MPQRKQKKGIKRSKMGSNSPHLQCQMPVQHAQHICQQRGGADAQVSKGLHKPGHKVRITVRVK
jgi:hypothetical protein